MAEKIPKIITVKITVEIPVDVYESLESVARELERSVPDIIEEGIDYIVPALGAKVDNFGRKDTKDKTA